MVKIHKTGRFIGSTGVGGNSVSVSDGDFITKTGGFLVKSTAGTAIEWVAAGEQTFASDNQTVATKKMQIIEKDDYSEYTMDIAGQVITFSGDLVTSNVVDINVNGVAMTSETFVDTDANLLTAIAAQLVTDFPTIIESATTGSHTIIIVPVAWNDTALITDVVVTLGAGQETAVVTLDAVTQADEGKFYDMTSGQAIDISTESATTGQVKFVKYTNWTEAIVNAVNA